MKRVKFLGNFSEEAIETIKKLPRDIRYFWETWGEKHDVNFFSAKGFLYIIGIDNRIKLGVSSTVLERLRNHNNLSKTYAGRPIDKAFIMGPFFNAYAAEKNLIELIKKSNLFTSFHGEEWFIGDFEKAVDKALELKDTVIFKEDIPTHENQVEAFGRLLLLT